MRPHNGARESACRRIACWERKVVFLQSLPGHEQGLLGAVDAPAQLDIQRLDNRQRIVSVSPIDGRVAEYELTTRVVFDYTVNGATQLSNETLSVTRNYSFDDTERLAAEAEQRDLLTSMHEELANLVFIRIARANDRLVAGDTHDGAS